MSNELDLHVASLVEGVDKLLWNCYRSAIYSTPPPCRLIFPQTSKGAVRVSEQEARQLLIQELWNTPFAFSTETPTIRKYRFSGKGERNAATDLTLYSPELERHLNVEFKAHNTSTKRIKRNHINKDMQKLVFEDANGFWFHVLEKANENGIETLWKTIRHELKTVVQKKCTFNKKLIIFHC